MSNDLTDVNWSELIFTHSLEVSVSDLIWNGFFYCLVGQQYKVINLELRLFQIPTSSLIYVAKVSRHISNVVPCLVYLYSIQSHIIGAKPKTHPSKNKVNIFSPHFTANSKWRKKWGTCHQPIQRLTEQTTLRYLLTTLSKSQLIESTEMKTVALNKSFCLHLA